MKIAAADLADRAACTEIHAFLAGADGAMLFHLPQWSRAVEKGCGARSHYLVSRASGGIEGLLPLSEIRSPLFGNALVSVGFAVGGGILTNDDACAAALADAAWNLARQRGCASVELRGGPLPGGPWETEEDVYAGFANPLAADPESILLSIRKNQRAEVRRGLRAGLEFRFGRSAQELDDFYRTYAVSVRNHGTPVFPFALFAAMLEEFGEAAEIGVAFYEGRPVSALFSFYFQGTASPYWGGGFPEARKLRANEALYYHSMCRAAARGCTRFDFGRSKVGTGPYAFKKFWGFEPVPFAYAVRAAGEGRRHINPLDPRNRLKVALWRRMPLALANRVGPLIARGLG